MSQRPCLLCRHHRPNMPQVSYLQLGAVAVTGAWGPAGQKADSLSVSAQFRAEVAPLLDAAASGEFCLADLQVACALLANPDGGAAAAMEAAAAAAADAAGAGGGDASDDDEMNGAGGAAGGGGGGDGSRGSVLVDALAARPFGEVLLGYAAVTPGSWAAGETEYGR